MKPVLLIFPGHIENKPPMPFSIVVLASYLRKKGIHVDLLDTRIDSFKNIDFNKYLLIGVSSKTGEQLSSAVEICSFIRETSKTPIVFGGPHASFFPEQTCNSDLVDFVIVGEGEETLFQLIKEMDNNKNFKNINGLIFKKNNQIISNPAREFLNMENLDLPAYDLIDLTKYQDKFQSFTIETSRGCPYRCSFCYVHDFHKHKWRSKKVEQSINEIKEIISKYAVRKFLISDDNFFVSKKKVLDFTNKLIDEQLNLELFAYARANYFSSFSKKEMGLLKKAGFKFIAIGAESGSQRVLDLIKKDIRSEDILDSAMNCIEYDIVPVYSFVIGIPGETDVDLNKTIDMFFKLKNISSNIEINGFYIFTPYPGTPIYHDAIKKGYKPCTSLEEWSKWKFSDYSNLPWLKKEYRIKLQVLSKIILFLFLNDRLKSYGKSFKRKKLGTWYTNFLWNIGSRLLFIDANFRLKNKFFYFGYEWLLFGKIALKFKVT